MKTIRQYMLNNYLLCPRLFKLCQEFETKQTEAMLKGKIFEGLLLGFKDEKEEKELCYTKDKKLKDKKKKDGTIIPGEIKKGVLKEPVKHYIELAEKLKHLFINGEHHKRLFIPYNEEYQLSFEPDYVGDFLIEHTGEIVHARIDIKLTGDINKIWDYKANKEDYFQAVSYTWAGWKITGEILPFYYMVIEDNDFETPVYRLIEMVITPSDLQWFENLCDTALNDIFLEPNCNHCLGTGKFDPRCRLISRCDHGRNLIGGVERIVFSDLPCEFDSVDEPFENVKNEKPKTFTDMELSDDLEETDFEVIENGSFKQITVCDDDKRPDGWRCRNCRTIAIKSTSDKECSNCRCKIIWI